MDLCVGFQILNRYPKEITLIAGIRFHLRMTHEHVSFQCSWLTVSFFFTKVALIMVFTTIFHSVLNCYHIDALLAIFSFVFYRGE